MFGGFRAMITAEEARNLMPKYDILNDGYPELSNLIESAARDGKDSIEYTITDSIGRIESFGSALLKLGYTINIEDKKYSPFSNRARYVLKIKW